MGEYDQILYHIKMNMKKEMFFFLGTEAELIKMFPVILICKERFNIHIIASGQNNLNESRILKEIKDITIEIELSREDEIKKSAIGLLRWYIKTLSHAQAKLKTRYYNIEWNKGYMLVHGDTVSTLMGAVIGKRLGLHVCHVEAGLRSHHLFNPFPEEIDRLLTSRRTEIHFAPGKAQCDNLKRVTGKVVDTYYNTILDSLLFSKNIPYENRAMDTFSEKYFVFVIHRQENLMNKKFICDVVAKIEEISGKTECVFILHLTTEIALKELGLYVRLAKNSNIRLVPRMNYFDFMKLLDRAEYVITDGGSNQEELFYMGKPCLIMRKNTERNEGIGQNAIMYEGDLNMIDTFAVNYHRYRIQRTKTEVSPSQIICDYLANIEN